jgi:hypothetical protein
MSKKEKHLPTPPNRAFVSRKKFGEEEEKTELTSDRMAMAAAEGKLEEFLKKEMPDNEYARNLASMMMGMTGIMPAVSEPASPPQESKDAETADATEVPEDVRKAIEGGNVQGLMEMLRREHQKRNPESEAPEAPEASSKSEPAQLQETPSIDKALVDALIQIAQDNSVSLDWIILRAIKVYVQEYRKSGKL